MQRDADSESDKHDSNHAQARAAKEKELSRGTNGTPGVEGDIVFLVWAPSSPRAEGLSKSLDAKLILLSYKFKKKIYFPVKYPLLFAKTLSILSRYKPNMIFCQEPSPLCTLAALTYRSFAGRKLDVIVDAHTAAFEQPWSRLKPFHKVLLGKARAVIVTNEGLKNRLATDYGIRDCVVLPDRLPDFKTTTALDLPKSRLSTRKTNSPFRVAVISSFAPDEPLEEVLGAARLTNDVTFYITGDFSLASSKVVADAKKDLPNVIFTGYLDRADYIALLSDVNAVIALTKRKDTMLSGANEALSLAKPLITSAHTSLVQYYSGGTLFVDNSPQGIAEAVHHAVANEAALRNESIKLRENRLQEWRNQFEHTVTSLGIELSGSDVAKAGPSRSETEVV